MILAALAIILSGTPKVVYGDTVKLGHLAGLVRVSVEVAGGAS